MQNQTRSSAFETSWGWVASAFTGSGLLALTLPKSTRVDAEESLVAQVGSIEVTLSRNNSIAKQMNEYFNGQRTSFELPLDLSIGTAFQQAVWTAALQVPYGDRCSYAWIGSRIGALLAMRAVGSALGNNPIAVVVPCHRIVRSDGGLGGYGGGLAMKRRLLKLESTCKTLDRSILLPD